MLNYLLLLQALGGAYKYPKKEIDDMWEATLLCQFHDCLPGSSIEMCYDDSDELYAKVFEAGREDPEGSVQLPRCPSCLQPQGEG